MFVIFQERGGVLNTRRYGEPKGKIPGMARGLEVKGGVFVVDWYGSQHSEHSSSHFPQPFDLISRPPPLLPCVLLAGPGLYTFSHLRPRLCSQGYTSHVHSTTAISLSII